MDRRAFPDGGAVVAFDRFVLDLAARRLTFDGAPIALHARAFDLLAILVEHRGQAVSREHLYELLWPQGFVEDGNLTQHIYLLRRVLDPSGNGRRFIETLPRHGYRFAAPVSVPRRRPRHAVTAALAACLLCVTLVLSGSALRPQAAPLPAQAAIAYALGLYHWNMRTSAEIARSIPYFKRTIELAPRNPLGYAGLADVYLIKADDKDSAMWHYVRLAERYRDRALALDPNNAEAHAVTAFIDNEFDNDAAAAEREYAIVFALKPEYATAHHWHAVMRFAHGDIAGALQEWEFAHGLEPTSEVISRWLGIAYFYARRPADAVAVLTQTLQLQPNDHEAWIQLASAQELRGNFHQAVAALEHVKETIPRKASYVAVLEARANALSRHGIADESTMREIRHIGAARGVDPSTLAYYFAAVGKRDEAIALLRRARPKYLLDASFEKYDPRFDSLRSDPRFKAIFD